jgi:hypothetical protein
MYSSATYINTFSHVKTLFSCYMGPETFWNIDFRTQRKYLGETLLCGFKFIKIFIRHLHFKVSKHSVHNRFSRL